MLCIVKKETNLNMKDGKEHNTMVSESKEIGVEEKMKLKKMFT